VAAGSGSGGNANLGGMMMNKQRIIIRCSCQGQCFRRLSSVFLGSGTGQFVISVLELSPADADLHNSIGTSRLRMVLKNARIKRDA
jgi:hypothetical protein